MFPFSKKTVKALTQKGITLVGKTYIPGQGEMPCANGETGYTVNDNGTGRVMTFSQVLKEAGQ